MTISIECTKCRKKLKAPAQAVGRRIKCPACQEVQTVVRSPAEPADDEESFKELSAASSVAPNLDDPFGGEVFSSDDMEDPQARKRRIAEKRVQRERERARAEEEAEEQAEQKRTKKVKVRAESARAEADLGQPFRYHWIYLIALVPLALSILWPMATTRMNVPQSLLIPPIKPSFHQAMRLHYGAYEAAVMKARQKPDAEADDLLHVFLR